MFHFHKFHLEWPNHVDVRPKWKWQHKNVCDVSGVANCISSAVNMNGSYLYVAHIFLWSKFVYIRWSSLLLLLLGLHWVALNFCEFTDPNWITRSSHAIFLFFVFCVCALNFHISWISNDIRSTQKRVNGLQIIRCFYFQFKETLYF